MCVCVCVCACVRACVCAVVFTRFVYFSDVILGFQSSPVVRVSEGVGDVELCIGVFNPAPDEVLNTTLTLTIETISDTAGRGVSIV